MKVRRKTTRPIDTAQRPGSATRVPHSRGGGNGGPKMMLLECKGVSTAGVATVPDAVASGKVVLNGH